MNKKQFSLLSIILSVIAQSGLAKGNSVTASSIWEYGAGARSFGMARAFTAMVNDASASYWNPAALADLSKQEILALHSPLETGAVYDYLGYAYPTISHGGIGFGIVRIGISGIEERNATNSNTMSAFSYNKMGIALAYGRRFGSSLLAGSSLKVISRSVPGASSNLSSMDLALMYKIAPHSKLGLNGQNVFSLTQNTSDRMDFNLKAGIVQGFLRDTFKLAVEFQSLPSSLHVGSEYTLKGFSLRAGIETEETTVGMGYTWKDISFDYALGLRELGSAHRIGLGYAFGKNVKTRRQDEAKKALETAAALFKKGQYLAARDETVKAITCDPDNRDTVKLDRKLLEIGRIFNLRKHELDWKTLTPPSPASGRGDSQEIPSPLRGEGGGEGDGHKATLVKSGLTSYLDNDNERAALFLDQALAFDPKDEQIRELFIRTAKLAGRNDLLTKPVIEPDVNLAKRLAEAEEDFWNARYEIGAKKCEEVLALDPNNVLAHTRLGSFYFALGLKERAIKEWETALQLNPGDPVMIDILKKVTRKN